MSEFLLIHFSSSFIFRNEKLISFDIFGLTHSSVKMADVPKLDTIGVPMLDTVSD